MNCTDSSGNDVFQHYRNISSIVETIDLTFTSDRLLVCSSVEDYLIHANHPFYRLSYEGCFSTPEFTSIIVGISLVVLLLLIVGGACISKFTKKVVTKKKEEKEKNRLLYS